MQRHWRSLLLSTVVSLPCEVSTEALISDLELTRVSVDRFTAESAYPRGWFSLIGSVFAENRRPAEFKSLLRGSHSKLPSRPSIRVLDSPILNSRVPCPRAHVCSSAGPPPAPSSVLVQPRLVTPRTPHRCRSVFRRLGRRPWLCPARRPSRPEPVGCQSTIAV